MTSGHTGVCIWNLQTYCGRIAERSKTLLISGQSYKASMSVNYDSTVVITSKLLIFMTLDL